MCENHTTVHGLLILTLPTAQAGRGISPNQSQPNPGSPADGSSCTLCDAVSFLYRERGDRSALHIQGPNSTPHKI